MLVRPADYLGRPGCGRMVGLLDKQGQELTHAGVSVLRFDDQGQVVEHRDYAHHIE